MMPEPLDKLTRELLGEFAQARGFSIHADGDQTSGFGAVVTLESDSYIITIVRDRDQHMIAVGPPKSPRLTWPLGHLIAYLCDESKPRSVTDLTTEASWLIEYADRVLDLDLLTSPNLNKWAVAASRRLFK